MRLHNEYVWIPVFQEESLTIQELRGLCLYYSMMLGKYRRKYQKCTVGCLKEFYSRFIDYNGNRAQINLLKLESIPILIKEALL